MSRRRDDVAEEIDRPTLAASVRRTFLLAAATPEPDADPDPGPAWQKVAAVASAQFLGAGDDGEVTLRWTDLAGLLYHAYRQAAGGGVDRFDDAPRAVRVAWEAAARHAANLLSAGAEALADLKTHEDHWGPWAAERLARAG